MNTNHPNVTPAESGRVQALVRWLLRCRHKWEDNAWLEDEVIEQRCLKCNGHKHRGADGEPWVAGRYPTLGKAQAIPATRARHCPPNVTTHTPGANDKPLK